MDIMSDLDQMSISVITNYIDENRHDITRKPWLGEIQYPNVINVGTESTTNIL